MHNKIMDRVLFVHEQEYDKRLVNQMDQLSVSVKRHTLEQLNDSGLIEVEVLVIVDPSIETLNRIVSLKYFGDNQVVIIACKSPAKNLIATAINLLHVTSIYDYSKSTDLAHVIENALIALAKKSDMEVFLGES